jgi:hypothetical protein
MSSAVPTHATAGRGSSSAGTSRIVFTTPFDPVPFFRVTSCGDELQGRHLLQPTVRRPDGSQSCVSVHWFGTTADLSLSEAEQARLFCHALIECLPEAALEDAVESLTGDCEMHLARLTPPKPLPEPDSRIFPAQIVERRVATLPPVIEID